MDTTITIRATASLRRALEQRARARKVTVSTVAREILQNALDERAMGERTGHVRGRLRLPRHKGTGWKQALRDHNWRP